MIKSYLKGKIKKKVISVIFVIVKPFIIPILIIVILIALICSITDVLYIAFDNDDKIDIKKELAYYNTDYEKDKDKKEVKGFFDSVWEFADKLFGGGGMSSETDWPVERILFNK